MTALILLSKFKETEIEIWRQVSGAPDYDVSNLGRVRSRRWKKSFGGRVGFKTVMLDQPRLIRTFPRCVKTPYIVVGLQTNKGERQFHVHRLVAEAFIANPEKLPQVNHKNLIKSDPRAGNLEWCTHQQNHAHATASGIRPKGEKHGCARLTEAQVVDIRARVAGGDRPNRIAKEYRVTVQNILRIVHRETWKHLP